MFGSTNQSGPAAYSPTYSSLVSNGQLVPVFSWKALASGNAVGPAFGGGPASPATVPPNASQGAPANSSATRAAGNSPFNFKTSAVPLLLVMLVASVLWLRYVHWGK